MIEVKDGKVIRRKLPPEYWMAINGWKTMKSAPKDREILAKRGKFVFITKYDSDNVPGSGFGIIHSCCGYHEDQRPTRWMEIP